MLLKYIHLGGPIMYLILLLNFTGFALIIWKSIQLWSERSKVDLTAKECLHFVQRQLKPGQSDEEVLPLAQEKLGIHMEELNSGLSLLKIFASISPLLGLLGTALGVLLSFNAIATQGLKEHAVFASGISMALITTVGGLVVAIPLLIAYNILTSELIKLESRIRGELLNLYLKPTGVSV